MGGQEKYDGDLGQSNGQEDCKKWNDVIYMEEGKLDQSYRGEGEEKGGLKDKFQGFGFRDWWIEEQFPKVRKLEVWKDLEI